jgi:hypothetical protein
MTSVDVGGQTILGCPIVSTPSPLSSALYQLAEYVNWTILYCRIDSDHRSITSIRLIFPLPHHTDSLSN